MSKDEIKIEKPDKIVDIVEKIFGLTPEQMLSRLPISLAHLKAGNNSEKHKNDVRQLLYSFYRSKN